MDYYLLGCLGGYTAEIARRYFDSHAPADFSLFVDGTGLVERDFGLPVLGMFDDFFYLIDPKVPLILIEIYLDIAVISEALLAGRLDG